MALTLATATQNAACDAVVDLIDAGAGTEGQLQIYDGTRPASANTAVGTQVLLADLPLANPAFGAAASGAATLQGVPIEVNAIATGTATWFRVLDTDGNTILDGSVGVSGTDLIVNTTTVTNGVAFRVTAGTVTMPSGE